MIKLNKIGAELAKLPYVNAMTDVTGFGLLGHLREMMEASDTSAQLNFEKVPLLDKEAIHHYLAEGCVPGGTNRNWASYGDKIAALSDKQRNILCDPQTSGGLLVAVSPEKLDAFEQFAAQVEHPVYHLGSVTAQGDKLVFIQ